MTAPTPAKQTPACPRCGGRLRLRPDQMGTEVICPKCSARFVVGAKSTPPPVPEEDDSYLPEVPLVRSSIVRDEPRVAKDNKITFDPAPAYTVDDPYEPEIPLTRSIIGGEQNFQETLYEGIRHSPVGGSDGDELEREEAVPRSPADTAGYFRAAEARGLVRSENSPDPPPRWTFFSGVLTFPFVGINFLRWLSNSLITMIAAPFLLGIAHVITSRQGPELSDIMLFLPIGFLFAALGMYLSACFVAAVQDTSDGHAQVLQETMPEFRDWWILMFGVLNVAMIAGAIGYPLTLAPEIGALAVPISMLVFFPILMLSAMEVDSFFMPLSALTWASLTRYWSAWLMFYLVSTFMLLGVLTAIDQGLQVAELATAILAGPVVIAAVLIYGRLLGRLAWRIGEDSHPAVAKRESAPRQEAEPEPAPRKRKKKLGRVTAADLDAASEFLALQRPKK